MCVLLYNKFQINFLPYIYYYYFVTRGLNFQIETHQFMCPRAYEIHQAWIHVITIYVL